MSSQSFNSVLEAYEAGKIAFERGRYRQSLQCFEAACQQVEKTSRLGGEVQLWLATAYQALGQQKEAIALCQKLTRHTHHQTRKQSRRLLEILQAPPLSSNMKGLIEFPDMSQLDDNPSQKLVGTSSKYPSLKRSYSQADDSQPIDLTQVNTEDNQFLWIALIGIIVILGGLLFLA